MKKVSRRNQAVAQAKADRKKGEKPVLSKYARKHRPPPKEETPHAS